MFEEIGLAHPRSTFVGVCWANCAMVAVTLTFGRNFARIWLRPLSEKLEPLSTTPFSFRTKMRRDLPEGGCNLNSSERTAYGNPVEPPTDTSYIYCANEDVSFGLGLLRSANQSKCTLILVGNELPSANRRIGSGPSGGVSKLSTRNHLRNANAFNTLDLPEAFAPKNATAFGTRMPLPSCKLPKRPSSSGTPALIVKSITCVSRIE